MGTKHYSFETKQDPDDGTWNFYDKDSSVELAWGSGYLTREQAEVAAEQFADTLRQRDEIRREAKERVAPVIAELFSSATARHTIDRDEILECVADGIKAKLEDLLPEQ